MSWGQPTRWRTRVLATSMLTALAVSVSACSGDTQPTGTAGESPSATRESPRASETPPTPSPTAESTRPSASPTSSPTAAASSTRPAEPSTTIETAVDTPSATEVQQPPAGSGPQAMLLRVDEIPGLNDEHGWKPIATEHRERRQPVWACQVTDFFSIGATDVWVRRFVGRPGGGDSAKARSAVITFVDDKSAERAYAVLRAWHDRCEDQLGQDYRRVSVDAAPTAVQVEDGSAEWRMAIYGPVPGERDAGYFDATGYVRNGKRISLTTMVSVGQDYNYPAGGEPIVGAVRASAVKLLG